MALDRAGGLSRDVKVHRRDLDAVVKMHCSVVLDFGFRSAQLQGLAVFLFY